MFLMSEYGGPKRSNTLQFKKTPAKGTKNTAEAEQKNNRKNRQLWR